MKTGRTPIWTRLFIAALPGLFSINPASAQSPGSSPATRMDDFIRLFEADNRAIDGFYQMPWSEAAFELIRAGILNQPLAASTRAVWKFEP